MNKVKSFLKTTMATNFIKFPFFEVRGYTPTRKGLRKQSLERWAHATNCCTQHSHLMRWASKFLALGGQTSHRALAQATNVIMNGVDLPPIIRGAVTGSIFCTTSDPRLTTGLWVT